jgi:hypothetical protein
VFILWSVSVQNCTCLAPIIYLSLAYYRATFQEHTNVNRMWFFLLLQITLEGEEHEEEENKKTNKSVFLCLFHFCIAQKSTVPQRVAHFLWFGCQNVIPLFCGNVWPYGKNGQTAALVQHKGWGLWCNIKGYLLQFHNLLMSRIWISTACILSIRRQKWERMAKSGRIIDLRC